MSAECQHMECRALRGDWNEGMARISAFGNIPPCPDHNPPLPPRPVSPVADLPARISAALDREQKLAELLSRSSLNASLPLRRVEADRRVLARHSPPTGACDWCALWPETCPELLDLAARVDVQP